MLWGRHNATGDDQRKGLLYRHVDLDQPFPRHNGENTRCGRQGMGEVYPDTGTQLFLDFTVGSTGDESDTVNPAAGIFYDDYLFETLGLVREKAVGDPFDGLINAPYKGNLADETLAKHHKPCPEIALRHQTADQDEDERDDRPQSGNMKIEKCIRLIIERNNPQEVVHYIHDEKKDIDCQSCRNDDGKTGQKDHFYFLLQHIPVLVQLDQRARLNIRKKSYFQFLINNRGQDDHILPLS